MGGLPGHRLVRSVAVDVAAHNSAGLVLGDEVVAVVEVVGAGLGGGDVGQRSVLRAKFGTEEVQQNRELRIKPLADATKRKVLSAASKRCRLSNRLSGGIARVARAIKAQHNRVI